MGRGVRRSPKGRYNEAEKMAHEMFREEARAQRCCQMCGTTKGAWHPHHVVYLQHLREVGAPLYDTRNSMRLCEDCHRRHHNRSKVIPLAKLTAEHIAYAFEKLGLRAHSYLRERYEGENPRVEQALAQAEEEHGERTAEAAAPA